MRIVTKQALITTAATRYREINQRRNGEWRQLDNGRDAANVFDQLQHFGPEIDEATLTELVGDNRLTENICDECLQDREVTVTLAEEIHHPTDAVQLCTSCLDKAVHLAQASK